MERSNYSPSGKPESAEIQIFKRIFAPINYIKGNPYYRNNVIGYLLNLYQPVEKLRLVSYILEAATEQK